MDSDKPRPLAPREQTVFSVIALVLVVILGIAVSLLAREILAWSDSKPLDWNVLKLGSLAGLVGGAARSLFMFVREIGGHGEYGPDFYCSRWFLYLAKPWLGVVTGPLLLLAVGKALVPGFTEASATPAFKLLPSVGVATAGGIFFEEAFAFISALVPSTVKKRLGNTSAEREHEPKA
jgi:hypothetical protein